MVDIPPIDGISFDPLSRRYFVVGFTPRWKQCLEESPPEADLSVYARPATWAQAILYLLEQFEYGWLGHYWTFPATTWTVQGHPCVLCVPVSF